VEVGYRPTSILEILTGTLFSALIFRTYGGLIAEEHYKAADFKMSLGLKDIRLALAEVESLLAPMPLAAKSTIAC
jgi:3-hydroxyisobutyrate dehydrogenase-like beta-hydroxyacid dehydrogenase